MDEYDSATPLTDREKEHIGANNLPDKDIYKRYGSTLLAAFLNKDVCFGFQIGDGMIAVINTDNEPWCPVGEDENCVFNRTTSICSSDAFDHFNKFYIPDGKTVAVMVATDGFTTSFVSEESLMNQCANIAEFLRTNEEYGALSENLRKRSMGNTQDDVSLSTALILQPIAEKRQKPSDKG